jgi:hypothetical protein
MLVSGLCVRKKARKTPVLGGGGTVAFQAARSSGAAKTLAGALCICSRPCAALLNIARPSLGSPETRPEGAAILTFGFKTRRVCSVAGNLGGLERP